MSLEDRLADMSEESSTGCRVWTAALTTTGYGAIRHGNRMRKAHSLMWEVHHGPIPEGMVIRHTCDNPLCVNIDHLLLGTQQDNLRDCVARGRSNRGSKHGMSKLTEEQVIEIRHQVSAGARQRDVAGRFGVSQATVSDICRRKSWAHLT